MDVTRYGLGARGIDYMQKIAGANLQNPVTSEAYPVYDGHGNMVATLAKSTTLPTLANQRTYDAWGAVRAGSGSAEPKGRYVANLGHVQDDESGLVYMRARYYEPGLGRFVSQDSARQGGNWLVYCNNDPVNLVDRTGNRAGSVYDAFAALGLLFAIGAVAALGFASDNSPAALATAISLSGAAVLCFSTALSGCSQLTETSRVTAGVVLGVLFTRLIATMVIGAKAGSYTSAAVVVFLTFAYCLIVCGALWGIDEGEGR